MSEQSKACHVGTGVNAVFDHAVPGCLVQRGHERIGQGSSLLAQELGALRRCEYSDAEGLGQKKNVSLSGAAVGQDSVRMYETSDGQAVLGLLVKNAVSPGNQRSGLIRLFIAAPEHGMHGLLRHILGHAHDVQRQFRLAAHGVYIRERIGGCDLAKKMRVVCNRREKIQRLHDCKVVAHPIDAGIVGLVKAHQQIWIGAHGNILQQLCQHSRADLCAAAGTLCQLRQFDILFHSAMLPSI